MKYQTYKYEDGIVTLTFQFEENEKIVENKQKFLLLLTKAIADLESDLL